MTERIAFIGGGNMASAIIGGLIKQGTAPTQIDVLEPLAEARDKLLGNFAIKAQAEPGAFLSQAALLVWAIKPQMFRQVALGLRPYLKDGLHLSVAAGIRSDSIVQWLGSERVVRAMPNTPALIGQGITALFARAAVTKQERERVRQVMAATGQCLWLEAEDKLDAVTALSGSGPAYVYYFMEAMITAGIEMGLPREQAQQLTLATFAGASAMASSAAESPKALRQQVTSRGGTTFAAISSMEDADLQAEFINAIYAARQRARELGDEFGAA